MTPSLNLIATVVNARLGTNTTELRFGHGDAPRFARQAYAWLADYVTDVEHAGIGLWLGVSDTSVWQLISDAETARADPAIAEQLDDIALEIHAEHLTRDRLGKLRPERTAREAALHALNRNGMVSVDDMRTLAAGYLALAATLAEERTRFAAQQPKATTPPNEALLDAARAVTAAHANFVMAQFSPRERSTRIELDRALIILSNHPELKQEAVHG